MTEDKLDVKQLLELTGQNQDEGFEYDDIVSIWVKTEGSGLSYPIGALGTKDDTIMDLGVHPSHRRKGVGRLLVSLTDCIYASAVTEEGVSFWKGIGWIHTGDKLIIDTWVKQFKRP